MSKPIAVIISDVHFTVPTLELATQATKVAMKHAHKLGVPIIFNGDTLDGKAIMRAEVTNRILSILEEAPQTSDEVIFNVGNHDLINEKSSANALNFLREHATVVSEPVFIPEIDAAIIPYQTDPGILQKSLARWLKKGVSRLILHQGVQGAYLGHYTQDKTSLPPEAFADFRVVSGHYHRAQDIKCGPIRKGTVGLFSYIGNPYSLSFGEANDGPKGYAVLYDDGTLERVPLDLRKHVIIELQADLPISVLAIEPRRLNPGDLIWLKLTGPATELAKIKKAELGQRFFGHANFKLDKIPTDAAIIPKTENHTPWQVLDSLIDGTDTPADEKTFLKTLAREVVNEAPNRDGN